MVQDSIIDICLGSTKEVKDKAYGLLESHYQELTLNKDFVKLEIDWDKYFRLEKAGNLISLLAKVNQRVVGYAAFFLYDHPHYKSLKVASNDVLFVEDEFRRGTTAGIRLIKCSEEILKAKGIDKIIWHIKDSNDFSPILKRMGYAREEVLMGKILRK